VLQQHEQCSDNQSLSRRRCRYHLTVAKGPMITASCTGTAGSSICAPEDHPQHVDEIRPRKPRCGSGCGPIRTESPPKRGLPFCVDRSTPIYTLNHRRPLTCFVISDPRHTTIAAKARESRPPRQPGRRRSQLDSVINLPLRKTRHSNFLF
jgi:hypothetical protein